MQDRFSSSEEKYSTVLNGRVNFSKYGKNPLARRQITYKNPLTEKTQTQNYMQMQDVVVPVILRHNEIGELEFAAIYEYIPAVKKIMFELPECPFFDIKKGKYSPEETIDCVTSRISELGMEIEALKWLDSQETPVSQSITDQQALFVAVYVKGNTDSKDLHWFSVNSIKDCLNKINSNSSLQTKYALQLFYRKFKELIDKQSKKFVVPDVIGQSLEDWKDIKNIMQNKHRFGIQLAESTSLDSETNREQYAEYIQSRNSANCLLVKKGKSGIKIGLAKQLRSPFIEREGVDDTLYESVGGMVDGDETYLDAVKREAIEESGYDLNDAKLLHVSTPTISSKAAEEHSDYYVFLIDENAVKEEQILDEDEAIESTEWFRLDDIDNNIRLPLSTKYLIEMLREELSKERELEI